MRKHKARWSSLHPFQTGTQDISSTYEDKTSQASYHSTWHAHQQIPLHFDGYDEGDPRPPAKVVDEVDDAARYVRVDSACPAMDEMSWRKKRDDLGLRKVKVKMWRTKLSVKVRGRSAAAWDDSSCLLKVEQEPWRNGKRG